MKFTLALLATAFALVTQTAAAPQGSLPIFICNAALNATCPNGLHCCPPINEGGDGL
ncbi:hypothetical protein D9619_006623 [Psilocybe cf. subviscida]|uniref:Hydrophobin n=1 Tax=Psilocybe cf. subviscida TaxID=2480587 RepID=A0A8H5EXX6_9AGAR|nr:hypothetical protein D9619_006623 [Psilocybe cf. subviscida]